VLSIIGRKGARALARTEADLTTLDAAILAAAQGRSVTFRGRSWTSQDLPELRALRAEIARAVGTANATTRSYRLASHAKGV
jgi:hypothetical protein